jgi:lysophospholipase L1-like esterase
MTKSQRYRTLLLRLAIVLLGLPCPSAFAAQSLPWTGTWAVSPMRDGSVKTFHGQTIRQIVHTSIGGSAARVHVSNVFGDAPLHIQDVHIAQRSQASAIVPATDREVRFGGRTEVIVPAGADITSDPVAIDVHPSSDMAISIYVPGELAHATFHPSGFQTNYVADGNVSESAVLRDPQTMRSYYLITNLDVQNPTAIGSVVTLGASITDGYSSAADANRRWPNDLSQRLIDARIHVGVLNQGISGNKLLAAGAGESAETRFDRDVLGQPGVRWVIFSDEPINDLGAKKSPPSGDQLIAGIQRLIVRAHKNKVRFLCSTLTPYRGAGGWTEAGESARQQIDAFLRSEASGCDGLVDADSATHDPANPDRYLPAYDSGDHLHPNTAGLQAIANAIDLSLFSATTKKRIGKR